MNIVEHLLVIGSEEASELSRMFSRINRFGLDAVHPRTEMVAGKQLVEEMNEILAVISLLEDRGVTFEGIGEPTAIGAAKKKMIDEMEISLKANTLVLPDDEEEEEAGTEETEGEEEEESTEEDETEEDETEEESTEEDETEEDETEDEEEEL